MVFGKQKSIAEIQREIAEQRKELSKEQSLAKKVAQRQQLQKQLFELRNRRLIAAGSKAKRLSARLGRGILELGRRAAPVLQNNLLKKQGFLQKVVER